MHTRLTHHATVRTWTVWTGFGLALALTLAACSGGGSSSGGGATAGASGTNTVTGIMPASSATAQNIPSSPLTMIAKWLNRLTTTDSAYAVSKGAVAIAGSSIKAAPMGDGRFELLHVPDGAWTLTVTTPDGESGTIPLTLPPGGGAVIDLGHVTVWKGKTSAHYEPSHERSLYPGFIQIRGAVSGLSQTFTQVPAGDTCERFVAAGLTLCFDRHTEFNPPLQALSFENTDPSGKVVEIVAEPFGDATSNVFRARRIQRNNGSASANDNTVQAVGPITELGADTITLFSTPMIVDNDPTTPDLPNKHAITFNTIPARFNPHGLEQHLSRGLVVQIDTPKKNKTAPAVTLNTSGQQIADADRVTLVRLGEGVCEKGEFIRVTGEVFSPNANTSTFGLATAANGVVFVQTDAATQFDEPLTGFTSLVAGQFVNVFALPPNNVGGPLRAILVDTAAAAGEIEVRGVVSLLDTTKQTFVVSGITFCYSDICTRSTPTEFVGAAPIANGQFVEVLGKAPASAGGLSPAVRVELESDPRPSSCSDGKGRDDDGHS